jgi:hypothetical protein
MPPDSWNSDVTPTMFDQLPDRCGSSG